jgi:predicted molibdopterin-dependent oxidoreductase YjgC
MRVKNHPVLDFPTGETVTIFFEGAPLEAIQGEPIAAALHNAGVRVLRHSAELHRPRGLFCAIGNCSSCLMEVDGKPNVRVCVEKVRAGTQVRLQEGKGDLHERL